DHRPRRRGDRGRERAAAGRVRRPQNAERGHESGQERGRGRPQGDRARGRAGRGCADRDRRRRPGPVRARAGPPVRALLHHQAQRHRIGPADLAPLRGSARRIDRGRSRLRPRRRPVPSAIAPGGAERMKPTVLVIDDEKTFRWVVEGALSAEGFEVVTAPSGEAGLRAWRGEPQDLVLLDRNLPDTDGVKVLEEIVREARERGIDSLVVIATAYADVQSAVAALKVGAFAYVSKPLQLRELVVTVRKALEAKRLRSKVRQLAGRFDAALGDFLVGESPAMRQVMDMVDKVAQATETTVLIQ